MKSLVPVTTTRTFHLPQVSLDVEIGATYATLLPYSLVRDLGNQFATAEVTLDPGTPEQAAQLAHVFGRIAMTMRKRCKRLQEAGAKNITRYAEEDNALSDAPTLEATRSKSDE